MNKSWTNLAPAMNRWQHSSDKVLQIEGLPYPEEGLLQGILQGLWETKSLLIVTGRGDLWKNILSEGLQQGRIDILTPMEAFFLKEDYDAIIFDALTCHPLQKRSHTQAQLTYLYPHCQKLLILTSEKLLSVTHELFECHLPSGDHLTEPRILEHDLKGGQGLSQDVLAYLNYFVMEKLPCVMIFENPQEAKNVLFALKAQRPDLAAVVQDLSQGKGEDQNQHSGLVERAPGLYFTSEIQDDFGFTVNPSFIIYEAQRQHFHFTDFYFLCRQAGRLEGPHGDVILSGSQVSYDMHKCQKACRRVNRDLWEQGAWKK